MTDKKIINKKKKTTADKKVDEKKTSKKPRVKRVLKIRQEITEDEKRSFHARYYNALSDDFSRINADERRMKASTDEDEYEGTCAYIVENSAVGNYFLTQLDSGKIAGEDIDTVVKKKRVSPLEHAACLELALTEFESIKGKKKKIYGQKLLDYLTKISANAANRIKADSIRAIHLCEENLTDENMEDAVSAVRYLLIYKKILTFLYDIGYPYVEKILDRNVEENDSSMKGASGNLRRDTIDHDLLEAYPPLLRSTDLINDEYFIESVASLYKYVSENQLDNTIVPIYANPELGTGIYLVGINHIYKLRNNLKRTGNRFEIYANECLKNAYPVYVVTDYKNSVLNFETDTNFNHQNNIAYDSRMFSVQAKNPFVPFNKREADNLNRYQIYQDNIIAYEELKNYCLNLEMRLRSVYLESNRLVGMPNHANRDTTIFRKESGRFKDLFNENLYSKQDINKHNKALREELSKDDSRNR